MTQRQEKLLAMITFFHRFCVEHGVRYYAVGGTCLGAVRHQGFIPWDDDIDVGVPRTDYDRLKSLAKEMAETSQYRLEFPLENEDYTCAYAKLYDTTTTLIEKAKKPVKRGIYIDVFPLDGLGDEQSHMANFKKVDFKLKCLYTRICSPSKDRPWYNNLAILCSKLIPACLLGKKKLIKDIEKLSKANDYESSAYVANLTGAWHEREIMKREWMGNPTLANFENTQIFIPENVDAYLTKMYRNYMQLPPEEKRCSHHDFLYENLNESYL